MVPTTVTLCVIAWAALIRSFFVEHLQWLSFSTLPLDPITLAGVISGLLASVGAVHLGVDDLTDWRDWALILASVIPLIGLVSSMNPFTYMYMM